MDNAARARQRVLAIFLPVTAVLYISAEALSPKGTDQVISTTATALKMLPIAARHPAQLYVAGSLALLGLGGLAVSYAAIAALVAQRPGLVRGLVLVGLFASSGGASVRRRFLLRVVMAPRWAAVSWKSCLPKLDAGRRLAGLGGYRGRVVAGVRRPGHARVFSAVTGASRDLAVARLAGVAAPAVVVMGGQDRGFPGPRAEAGWDAGVLRGQVVLVPVAGRCPRSRRPGIAAGAVLRFPGSVTGRA
jgi:hypothetical protein